LYVGFSTYKIKFTLGDFPKIQPIGKAVWWQLSQLVLKFLTLPICFRWPTTTPKKETQDFWSLPQPPDLGRNGFFHPRTTSLLPIFI
jgi:hypothetical protein